jgi:hypothetical protein
MKIISLLLSLCLASVALAEDPAELERLRHQWEQSVAKDVDDKNKIYLKALEKLQKKFMEAKNLAAAVAVDNEIKMVRVLKPTQQRKSFLDGVWIASSVNGVRIRPIFSGKMVNYWKGRKFMSTCSIKAGVVEIKQDDGWWWKLKINPDNSDIMEGVNKGGSKVTFKRFKW